ncbi:MAG: hypothetical protein AAGC95_01575 [Pseudomonadota bacterium]
MSDTPIVRPGPGHIESAGQPAPQNIGRNEPINKVGTGIIDLRLKTSHIEVRGGSIPKQVHGIAPPGPNAAQGMQELGRVAATNFDSSVDALTLVKTLMTKLHGLMSNLREQEHGMMKHARQEYVKSVDDKIDNMHDQADAAMGFGITSALVGCAFSVGSTACAFQKGVDGHLAMAKTQALSGAGGGLSGVLDAIGKGVDTNLEARNVKSDKFAQLYQGFQQEFKEAVESAAQSMQAANSAMSEAGGKDDSTMGVMIRNLS